MSDNGDWWASPAPDAARPARRRGPVRALLVGTVALAVLLAGGAAFVDGHRAPLSAAALPGSSSSAGDTNATNSGRNAIPAPKPGTNVPAPILTIPEIASRVEPGVVIIRSELAYQNAEAAGTGMILSAGGTILTNNHVIAGADRITVTVEGTGRQYAATVVGTAVSNDIAVLQLQGASGLSTIPLGDSSSVRVGQSAVAIGNAGGEGILSVVSGDITSTDRTITASDESGHNSERLSGMLEVQAPIRAGDSGGPLSNRAGQVIGMNTAASTGQNQPQAEPTVGFAIPINRAIAIAQQIRNGIPGGGRQIGSRGYLGIQVRDADPTGGSSGALVVDATAGSPAASAGIEPGDTITTLNGSPVATADALTKSLTQSKPGQQVMVGWTDPFGEAHTAQVTLTSGPAD